MRLAAQFTPMSQIALNEKMYKNCRHCTPAWLRPSRKGLQPMAEDRIAALRQRMKHEGETTTPEATAKQQKQAGQSDRKRHTVYLSKTLMRAIDKAFKDASHDLYPLEIDKADYLESCLKYALAHQDEIKGLLASHQQ